MRRLTAARMEVVVEVEKYPNGEKIATIYLGTEMIPIKEIDKIDILEKIVEREFQAECSK